MCLEMADYLFSGGQAAAPAAEYGAGAAGDYLMGNVPAEAASGVINSDYAAGPMWSAIPSGGAGGGGTPLSSALDTVKPFIGPAATAGSMIYGANQQSKMGRGLANAQQQSYDQYLNAINPPEAVKQAMFNKVNSQILSSAPLQMRKISNELASRGVRGQGTASPIAGAQRGVTGAQRNAYLDIYGRYNVPNQPGPTNWAPTTGNLMGKNVGDIGTLMMMQKMFG